MKYSVVGKFRFQSSETCCICSRFIGLGRLFVRSESKIAHYNCAKKRGWEKEPKVHIKTRASKNQILPRKIVIIRNGRGLIVPTKEEVEKAKTPQGGWTRKQLAEWGVPWPPPKGWKQRLIDDALKARPALASKKKPE